MLDLLEVRLTSGTQFIGHIEIMLNDRYLDWSRPTLELAPSELRPRVVRVPALHGPAPRLEQATTEPQPAFRLWRRTSPVRVMLA